MSTFYPCPIVCPCGAEFTTEIARGIHASRLPKVREAILANRFQVVTCPECGEQTSVMGSSIYTDFVRNQYVAVETRYQADWAETLRSHELIFENSFTHGPPLATAMGVKFAKRCVIGFPALREKLMIWDLELDDLAVEAAKAQLLERKGLEPGDALFRLATALPGGHLLFHQFDAPAPVTPTPNGLTRVEPSPAVDMETVLATDYQREVDTRDSIVERYPWLGSGWLVDLHDGFTVLTPSRR